jgi:hypothetical protein
MWYVVCGMKERRKAKWAGKQSYFDCSPRTKASLVRDEINLGLGPRRRNEARREA